MQQHNNNKVLSRAEQGGNWIGGKINWLAEVVGMYGWFARATPKKWKEFANKVKQQKKDREKTQKQLEQENERLLENEQRPNQIELKGYGSNVNEAMQMIFGTGDKENLGLLFQLILRKGPLIDKFGKLFKKFLKFVKKNKGIAFAGLLAIIGALLFLSLSDTGRNLVKTMFEQMVVNGGALSATGEITSNRVLIFQVYVNPFDIDKVLTLEQSRGLDKINKRKINREQMADHVLYGAYKQRRTEIEFIRRQLSPDQKKSIRDEVMRALQAKMPKPLADLVTLNPIYKNAIDGYIATIYDTGKAMTLKECIADMKIKYPSFFNVKNVTADARMDFENSITEFEKGILKHEKEINAFFQKCSVQTIIDIPDGVVINDKGLRGQKEKADKIVDEKIVPYLKKTNINDGIIRAAKTQMKDFLQTYQTQPGFAASNIKSFIDKYGEDKDMEDRRKQANNGNNPLTNHEMMNFIKTLGSKRAGALVLENIDELEAQGFKIADDIKNAALKMRDEGTLYYTPEIVALCFGSLTNGKKRLVAALKEASLEEQMQMLKSQVSTQRFAIEELYKNQVALDNMCGMYVKIGDKGMVTQGNTSVSEDGKSSNIKYTGKSTLVHEACHAILNEHGEGIFKEHIEYASTLEENTGTFAGRVASKIGRGSENQDEDAYFRKGRVFVDPQNAISVKALKNAADLIKEDFAKKISSMPDRIIANLDANTVQAKKDIEDYKKLMSLMTNANADIVNLKMQSVNIENAKLMIVNVNNRSLEDLVASTDKNNIGKIKSFDDCMAEPLNDAGKKELEEINKQIEKFAKDTSKKLSGFTTLAKRIKDYNINQIKIYDKELEANQAKIKAKQKYIDTNGKKIGTKPLPNEKDFMQESFAKAMDEVLLNKNLELYNGNTGEYDAANNLYRDNRPMLYNLLMNMRIEGLPWSDAVNKKIDEALKSYDKYKMLEIAEVIPLLKSGVDLASLNTILGDAKYRDNQVIAEIKSAIQDAIDTNDLKKQSDCTKGISAIKSLKNDYLDFCKMEASAQFFALHNPNTFKRAYMKHIADNSYPILSNDQDSYWHRVISYHLGKMDFVLKKYADFNDLSFKQALLSELNNLPRPYTLAIDQLVNKLNNNEEIGMQIMDLINTDPNFINIVKACIARLPNATQAEQDLVKKLQDLAGDTAIVANDASIVAVSKQNAIDSIDRLQKPTTKAWSDISDTLKANTAVQQNAILNLLDGNIARQAFASIWQAGELEHDLEKDKKDIKDLNSKLNASKDKVEINTLMKEIKDRQEKAAKKENKLAKINLFMASPTTKLLIDLLGRDKAKTDNITKDILGKNHFIKDYIAKVNDIEKQGNLEDSYKLYNAIWHGSFGDYSKDQHLEELWVRIIENESKIRRVFDSKTADEIMDNAYGKLTTAINDNDNKGREYYYRNQHSHDLHGDSCCPSRSFAMDVAKKAPASSLDIALPKGKKEEDDDEGGAMRNLHKEMEEQKKRELKARQQLFLQTKAQTDWAIEDIKKDNPGKPDATIVEEIQNLAIDQRLSESPDAKLKTQNAINDIASELKDIYKNDSEEEILENLLSTMPQCMRQRTSLEEDFSAKGNNTDKTSHLGLQDEDSSDLQAAKEGGDTSVSQQLQDFIDKNKVANENAKDDAKNDPASDKGHELASQMQYQEQVRQQKQQKDASQKDGANQGKNITTKSRL